VVVFIKIEYSLFETMVFFWYQIEKNN
jgi:hypothetical protein